MTPCCPHCGRENPAEALLCVHCGAIIDSVELVRQYKTREVDGQVVGPPPPRWGTTTFDRYRRLVLREGGGDFLVVDVHRTGRVVLGRYDPETGTSPGVDLTPFRAQELGVSRQHARLEVHDRSLFIADLGSTNGTYLNDARLPAHRPCLLRNGDAVRLGMLRMQVVFVASDTVELSGAGLCTG